MSTKNSSEEHKDKALSQDVVSSSIFIGEYEIVKHGEEHFKIIKKYNDDFKRETIICGGDFETLLNCLFISTEQISYVYEDVYKTTVIKSSNDKN
jgi:hypothetical protein